MRWRARSIQRISGARPRASMSSNCTSGRRRLRITCRSIAHASWLAAVLPAGADESAVHAFIAAVLPNIVLPEDARPWVDVVFGGPPALGTPEEQGVRTAGSSFFSAAAQAAQRSGNDLKAIAAAVARRPVGKARTLYMPLRVALTGLTHGPELAPLLKAMPPGAAYERLARFA